MSLDPETKARIEAEEAYRAEVRARPQGKPPTHKGRQNGILLLVLGIIAALYFLGSGLPRGLTSALPAPQGDPVGIEVQAQATPDNYGVDLFVTLKDAGGQEVAAAGNAVIAVYSRDYTEPEQVLWSKSVGVRTDQFSRGTRGQGAFERDAVFAELASVTTAELRRESGKAIDIRVRYILLDDTVLEAKEIAFLP
ncbi:hypothetical protein [Deinococcus budaensis]|uniref:Uncharacterized protein n=1 Tax=Deinococcus budaensis TaxID=1665626 RepID=A0A7W8GFP4_9DEIO|nr:hypothetical protein [Deinococcus budaensis]MBB5234479.1 hypothetical protein [Deinococcus budaensis]